MELDQLIEERKNAETYLKSLPDTAREYLHRELPIYLEQRKTSIVSLAKAVGINRNTLTNIVKGHKMESAIDPNHAGMLIEMVAPEGLHMQVLSKYFPWIKAETGLAAGGDAINSAFLAELLLDPTNYWIYCQSSIGEGVTEATIANRWSDSGVNKARILEFLGYVKKADGHDDDPCYVCTGKKIFRTVDIDHIVARIQNCTEYMRSFPQPLETATLGVQTAMLDEQAQKELKEATWDYSNRVAKIRSREMGPDAESVFVCYFTGALNAQNEEKQHA